MITVFAVRDLLKLEVCFAVKARLSVDGLPLYLDTFDAIAMVSMIEGSLHSPLQRYFTITSEHTYHSIKMDGEKLLEFVGKRDRDQFRVLSITKSTPVVELTNEKKVQLSLEELIELANVLRKFFNL